MIQPASDLVPVMEHVANRLRLSIVRVVYVAFPERANTQGWNSVRVRMIWFQRPPTEAMRLAMAGCRCKGQSMNGFKVPPTPRMLELQKVLNWYQVMQTHRDHCRASFPASTGPNLQDRPAHVSMREGLADVEGDHGVTGH